MYIRKDTHKVSEEEKGGAEWGGGVLDAFVSSFFSSYIFDSTSLT